MGEPVLEVPSGVAKEAYEEEVSVKKTGVVVIDEFDDLANLETIAATQGLTEADLQGNMTIIDASGNRFTWETFSPAAKFPIKLDFATIAAEQETDNDKPGPIN